MPAALTEAESGGADILRRLEELCGGVGGQGASASERSTLEATAAATL